MNFDLKKLQNDLTKFEFNNKNKKISVKHANGINARQQQARL